SARLSVCLTRKKGAHSTRERERERERPAVSFMHCPTPTIMPPTFQSPFHKDIPENAGEQAEEAKRDDQKKEKAEKGGRAFYFCKRDSQRCGIWRDGQNGLPCG
ncbi:hypothetical protein TRV_07271, partial [Trichophyton verrucosum HKI 0517]